MEAVEAVRDARVVVRVVERVARLAESASMVGCGIRVPVVVVGLDGDDLVGDRWSLNTLSSSPILASSACKLVSVVLIAFCSLLRRSRSCEKLEQVGSKNHS